MKRLWLPLALLAFTGVAFGAEPAASVTAPLTITLDAGAKSGAVSDALRIVMLLTLLAVLPAILIAMTSFTRTIIVLSMLRHAFGMQDTPPNMVLVSLALFLTLFTMAPAFQAAYRDGIRPHGRQPDHHGVRGHADREAVARVHDPPDPREGSGVDPGNRARRGTRFHR